MERMTGTTEELPALYRSILTLVEELERCDRRAEANRIRLQAVATYASAWDGRHQRRLQLLEERLRRSIASHRREPRSWMRLS